MTDPLMSRLRNGDLLHAEDSEELLSLSDLDALMALARELRDQTHGAKITFSRKVFIPLTQLCRDSCHYCTFAHPPQRGQRSYLSADEVLKIAREGAKAGCREALFTLGDKPEQRYRAAADELDALGYKSTIEYLAAMADLVWQETGLLPHLNPGVMSHDQIAGLRSVSVSQGLMLESASERLCERGGPHFGSPDKSPAARLGTIRAAGEAAVPFTSGILIGIGETRLERLEALFSLRDLHERYGHLQEIIVQNFRAKAGTKMSRHPEPSREEHLWTIAIARLIFGPSMNLQAPPNLSDGQLHDLIGAGINDWGGVSPVTPDHVNPERPWPHLRSLAQETAAAGKILVERLAVYPSYVADSARWISQGFRTAVMRASDSESLVRTDSWQPGSVSEIVAAPAIGPRPGLLSPIIDKAFSRSGDFSESDIVALFGARGQSFDEVCKAADALRREICGDAISYVVTRNINYTNICSYHCNFCAFSKGKSADTLRGRPYDLSLDEIQRRVVEAWSRGATEVCLQGGIHPDYTGNTYLSICRAVKAAAPEMHIHAFSPLEISQGAKTLGLSVGEFLAELKSAGLGSLPGTAAEILDDEVRHIICPDKVTTDEWLAIIETAHRIALPTTSTIMYGHVDHPKHWARHLLRLLHLQRRTGGLTEFVPLPFVPMETPINLRGQCRNGPSLREAVLMHAVARLTFNRAIPNIQTSWVKMGAQGAAICLDAGANDLGGTLMNERITRAAGAAHGQEMPPESMEALIRSIGRKPIQRTTRYHPVHPERRACSFNAAPLAAAVDTPPSRRRPAFQSNAAN